MPDISIIHPSRGNGNFKNRTLVERLHEHSIPEPNTGCWLWIGDSIKGGYGRIRMLTKNKLAHRISYECFVGAIPEGLEVHHKCNNPSCINPLHLVPMTGRENSLLSSSLASLNAKKVFCKRGHEFTPENIIYNRNGRTRRCKLCTVQLAKARYQNNREFYKEKGRINYQKNKALNSENTL